jgi:F420-dependent methylenetetrahydromethanopterin dehydrogenase
VIAGASREIIARLEAADHRVVFLGDVIRPNDARDLADCANVPAWLVSDAPARRALHRGSRHDRPRVGL